jgi:hypothetical protein
MQCKAKRLREKQEKMQVHENTYPACHCQPCKFEEFLIPERMINCIYADRRYTR